MSEKWLLCIAKKDDSDDVFYINHKFILLSIFISMLTFSNQEELSPKRLVYSAFLVLLMIS